MHYLVHGQEADMTEIFFFLFSVTWLCEHLVFLTDSFFKLVAETLACKSLLSCMETNKTMKVSICALWTQTVMKPKQPSPGVMLFKCQAEPGNDFNSENRSHRVRCCCSFSPVSAYLYLSSTSDRILSLSHTCIHTCTHMITVRDTEFLYSIVDGP